MSPRWSFAAPLLAALALASCAKPSAPRVEKAWVRPVADDGTTAGYFELVNDSAVPLQVTGARAGWCARVELHETVRDGARASMRPLPVLALAPRARASFRPGGRHVMLVGVRGGLAEGTQVPIALTLAGGDTLGFLADVRR